MRISPTLRTGLENKRNVVFSACQEKSPACSSIDSMDSHANMHTYRKGIYFLLKLAKIIDKRLCVSNVLIKFKVRAVNIFIVRLAVLKTKAIPVPIKS